LSSIESVKYVINKQRRRPIKKHKKNSTVNYFEFQYSTQSLNSNRKLIGSARTTTNPVTPKVEKTLPIIKEENSIPNSELNGSGKENSNLSSNSNPTATAVTTSNNKTSNNENVNKKKINVNKKSVLTNDLNNTEHPKNKLEEYFSTELLLNDTDDIFHINEDLFTPDQISDKHLIEKYNYNITNYKILDHFRKKQSENNNNTKQKDKKSINLEELKMEEDDKVTIYNSCRRRNLKKISNMMNITKNMTKNKSIITNFDYSDNEYGYSSSSSSSSDYSTKYRKHRKKRSPTKKNYTMDKNAKILSKPIAMMISDDFMKQYKTSKIIFLF